MNYEMKEQVAFIAASMITLADRSIMDLRSLTELIGADTIRMLLAMDSLRFELSYEEMAEEICACTGWEPALYAPYYNTVFLDRLGNQVADRISALYPPTGTEACLLLAILSSISPDDIEN